MNRSLLIIALLTTLPGCPAPATRVGSWMKAKGDEIRRLNEHPIYNGPRKFQNHNGRRWA